MLKFNKSSLLGLVPTIKTSRQKEQTTAIPAPAPTPETPLPLPLPSKASTPVKTPSSPTPTPVPAGSSPTLSDKPSASDISNMLNGLGTIRRDELFRLRNGYYDQPKSSQKTQKKVAVVASVIKPSDHEKFDGMVMMTDGGQSGVSEDGLIYDPRTRESEKGIDLTAPISAPRKTEKQKVSSMLGIPSEHAGLAKIVAMLPEDFDFAGWENMTAFQQEKAIRNSGLSKEDQMKILNAGTSIETIALVQDINMHRELYGISEEEALAVSKELFSIANARIGVKSHAMPYSLNGQAEKAFLALLDEREASLLANLDYGVVADFNANVPGQRNRPQLPTLLGDDSKGVPLLYEGGNILEISDSFFEDVATFDEIRDDIESGKIIFRSEGQKESYLKYLDSQAAKNETIYRRQFSEYIKTARIPIFRKEQLQTLSNELSVEQMQILMNEIDTKGITKATKNENWEKLMRVMLSDADTANQLAADEKSSPICPHVWEGMDIVKEDEVYVPGYFYENGEYYVNVQRRGYEPEQIPLGDKIPSDVTVRVTRSTSWDMFGEQIGLAIKYFAQPAFVVDAAYCATTEMGLIPAFLPPGLSPSDIPQVGELLESIDPFDHKAHITKETVTVSLFIEHGENGEGAHTDSYDFVQFDDVHLKKGDESRP